MLVQRAGQIVSRDEIHQQIWGTDTFVDFERSINFSINQIRAALGDDAARPRFIETIPRRGYRFLAAIENGQPGDSASATPIAQIENGEPAGAAASVIPISGDRNSTRLAIKLMALTFVRTSRIRLGIRSALPASASSDPRRPSVLITRADGDLHSPRRLSACLFSPFLGDSFFVR
jgi:DNA-binding winged helix-turn-helix (wHTH) protein